MHKSVSISVAATLAVILLSVAPCTSSATGNASGRVPKSSASASPDSSSKFLYRLLSVAQQQPNYGAAIKDGARAITIFGVGYATDRLESLIEEAPSHGVTAQWRRCPYTQKELTDEAARLMTKHSYINRSGPNRNAFALIVATTNKSLLSSYDPEAFLGTSFAVKVVKEGPAGP